MANIKEPIVLSSETLKVMQPEEIDKFYEQYSEYFHSVGIDSKIIFCFAQLSVFIAFNEMFKSNKKQ